MMLKLFSSFYWQFLYLPLSSVHVFCPFLIGLFVILLLICRVSLYVLNTRILSDISPVNIFSQSVTCLFIFLILSFNAWKIFVLMKSNLLTFSFMNSVFVSALRNFGQFEGWKDIPLFFFSWELYGCSFYDSCWIHVCRVLSKRLWLNFFHVNRDGQTQFVEKIPFSFELFLRSLSQMQQLCSSHEITKCDSSTFVLFEVYFVYFMFFELLNKFENQLTNF